MDTCYFVFSDLNGLSKNMMMDDKKRRNYKLVADPMLRGGGQKIYRFEGVDPAVRLDIHVMLDILSHRTYCQI